MYLRGWSTRRIADQISRPGTARSNRTRLTVWPSRTTYIPVPSFAPVSMVCTFLTTLSSPSFSHLVCPSSLHLVYKDVSICTIIPLLCTVSLSIQPLWTLKSLSHSPPFRFVSRCRSSDAFFFACPSGSLFTWPRLTLVRKSPILACLLVPVIVIKIGFGLYTLIAKADFSGDPV